MSLRTMHVTIDSTTISPARAVMAAARGGPLVILTERALRDLAAELGGDDAAVRHLERVATNVNRPIGANMSSAEGSRTFFLAPKGWSLERLKGWIAGHHEAIEAMFGTARIDASTEAG
jgi:hypothetical protein